MSFNFEYYSIEKKSKHNKEDSVFIPIYPTKEDEEKGVLPKYIGEYYFLSLIGDFYRDAISTYSAFYEIAVDPAEMDVILSQVYEITCNMLKLFNDIMLNGLAMPSSVFSLLSSNIFADDNCARLKSITEDLLRPDSSNRHNLIFSLAELKGDGSWTYEPNQEKGEDELCTAWANYLRCKSKYSSFEDYLFDWDILRLKYFE